MTPQEKATVKFAYFAFSVLIVIVALCIYRKETTVLPWATTSIGLILAWFFSRSLRSNRPNPEPPPGGSVTVTQAPKPATDEQQR